MAGVIVLLAGLTRFPSTTLATDAGAPGAGAGGAGPLPLGLEKHRRDCATGNLWGCLDAAREPQPEEDRLHLLEEACRLGPHGCVGLAFALAGGTPKVPMDLPRARVLSERLCNDAVDHDDLGAGCVILAQLTTDAGQVPKLLGRACRYGFRGIRGEIFSNYWLPGQPRFHVHCGERALGTPRKRRP